MAIDEKEKVKTWVECQYYPTTLFVTIQQPYDIPLQVFGIQSDGHWTSIMRNPAYRNSDRTDVLRQLKFAATNGVVNPKVTEIWGHVHPSNKEGVGALKDWEKQGILYFTEDKVDGVDMLKVHVPIKELMKIE